MLKYTILYKNGKTWNGKAAKIVDIPLVDCVVMAVTLTDSYTDRTHLYIPQRLGWGHLRPVWPLKGAPKVRTPNPNSKTKKQKAFDEDYEKWAATRRPEVYTWGSGHAEYSIQAYKKWLWEQKLVSRSKFVPPPVPGDRIGYYSSESGEMGWITVKDKDGLIPWNGGDCPVQHNIKVDVRFRDGVQYGSKSNAGAYCWYHLGCSSDIVAYKVYEDPKVMEEKLNPLTPEITRITGSSCDPYPTIRAKAGDHSTPKIGSTRLMEIHGEVRECKFLGTEGLDEKWWVMLNKAPIKTTYTFWLGANGEIVDDK